MREKTNNAGEIYVWKNCDAIFCSSMHITTLTRMCVCDPREVEY